MAEVSAKFVWHNISTLTAVWETFCGIHGTQFDISGLDIVDIFENIFDTALMQLTVNEKNTYEQQEILKTSGPFTFSCRMRSGFSYVYVDGHSMSSSTLVILFKELHAVHSILFEILPLERLELIEKFSPFSDNSKRNEFQGPLTHLFSI
jgi:hypothetical protein